MATATTGIETFKSALVHGGARPSLFEFRVTSQPDTVENNLNGVNLYCNVSELPGVSITPIERQYFGRTVKIPGDMVFADLTTTIINTETFNVRKEIEKWMEHINGTVSNVGKSAANFGTGTAELIHFQKNGVKTLIYEFIDIWPTSLSEIALSYDTSSEIEQFDCTWAYNYFKIKTDGSSIVTTHANQE